MHEIYLLNIELHPIKDEQSSKEGLYWKVDFPFPMSDRDVSNGKCYKIVCVKIWLLLEDNHLIYLTSKILNLDYSNSIHLLET